jgi:hypothetical protein
MTVNGKWNQLGQVVCFTGRAFAQHSERPESLAQEKKKVELVRMPEQV